MEIVPVGAVLEEREDLLAVAALLLGLERISEVALECLPSGMDSAALSLRSDTRPRATLTTADTLQEHPQNHKFAQLRIQSKI